MKYDSAFHLMADVLAKTKLKVVLVGGFAVNHYVAGRFTHDVDFLIPEDDYEHLVSFVEKAGYRVYQRYPNFIRLESESLVLMDTDLIFVDRDTFDGVYREGITVQIGEYSFVVPSLRHLIALKLHAIKNNPGRELRDLLDIHDLVRMNKVDVKGNDFRELCLKYGTQDLYDKILNAMRQ